MDKNFYTYHNIRSQPNITRPVIYTSLVISIFIGGFIIWSLLTPLESAAVASGKIVVDTHRKSIQHLEGGIIKQLYVRDGVLVQAGQLLLELDDTQAKATLELLRGRAHALLALEARLVAERDNAPSITFPARLLQFPHQIDIQAIIENQRALFAANQAAYQAQLTILNQRITQLRNEIASLQAQVESSSKQLALIEEEITAVAYLAERQLIEKPRLLALKREAARLIGNRGERLGLIAQAEQKIGETHTQIINLKTSRQRDLLEELRNTQRELADVLEREKAAEDILQRVHIRAPRTGTVVDMQFHTVGGVIRSGEVILDLIPSDDDLIIEARINPLDIDVIHVGQAAKIQLMPYKQRHLPNLIATLKRVSADVSEDPQTGELFYKAHIQLKKAELQKLGSHDIKLYPGMPTQVMIITGKRTPFNYLITPIRDSFGRAFRED